MAEKTAIAWTRSTFNPWLGCSKIGPGCDNCYAAEMDRQRFSRHLGGGTKEVPISHWGAGAPRHRTSAANWTAPERWNKKQELAFGEFAAGRGPRPEPWRVFCASLADVFDNEVPQGWRNDLWTLLRATPYLSWLLVTKRVGNVAGMVPESWSHYGFLKNTRLLITVCDQEEADRDIPKLLALPCKNGISYEPALGPVDWSHTNGPFHSFKTLHWDTKTQGGRPPQVRGIEWLIYGAESGPTRREADMAWSRSAISQCKAAGVPVFIKQDNGLRSGMQGRFTDEEWALKEFPDA